MRSRRPPRRPDPAQAPVHVGQWLMVLVALAGLVAMHGFSDHGVGGAVEPAHASMAQAADVTAGHPDHGSDHGRSSPTPGDGRPGHHGLLVGACLAVLGAALLRLLARWPGRGLVTRGAVAHALGPAVTSALRTRSRTPPPPDLRLLSIQRC